MTERIIDFEQSQIRQGDHIVRGVAADGMIRAFALTSRRTVQTAMENFQASPRVTAALGRLLMAGQMLGCMYKSPDELITIMVRGDGTTIVLWRIFGLFLWGIGTFVGLHILFRNVNSLAAAYNASYGL